MGASPGRNQVIHGVFTPPRRNGGWRRWAAAGLGAIVLLSLAGYLASRRVASPAAGPLEPGSLVVMPVTVQEPTNESGWLRQGLAEMIRSQLAQTPGIRIVARHRVAAALREAGLGEEAPSPETAGKIARLLRAERLLTGSFIRIDDRFVITAEIVNIASGQTEGAASVRGHYTEELLDSVDELCLRLLHTFGPGASARDSLGEAWRPARLATRSVEASRHYVEALSWFARGGVQGADEAEKRLDQALERDPGFAQAYLKKAEILHWRRSWGYGHPDPAPAVLAAARLMKDLPDRDRLLVESFESLIIRQQPEQALREWESLLRLHPSYAQEVGIPSLAADTLLRLGRWEELILVGEAHVDSSSLPESERALLNQLLSQAYRRRGELERAHVRAKQAVQLWPGQQGPRFLSQRAWLGRTALERGQRAEALAEFRAVAAALDADVVNLTDAAWGYYMAGERREAYALTGRALTMDPHYGNAYHLRGWLRLAEGAYGPAASDLEAAFKNTPGAFGNPHLGTAGGDLAALYYAGVAYQKLGEDAAAEVVFTRLIDTCRRLVERPQGRGEAARWQATNFRARAQARLGLAAKEPARLPGDESTYFVQTARLHAVQGREEDALRELAKGLALGFGERRHILDDPDFESIRSEPEFERLTRANR